MKNKVCSCCSWNFSVLMRCSCVLPVRTVCQPMEKGVLACTVYMVTGLWLSGPEPQDSCTVVSVMSLTTKSSGAPGGPVTPRNKDRHLYELDFKSVGCFRASGSRIFWLSLTSQDWVFVDIHGYFSNSSRISKENKNVYPVMYYQQVQFT